MALSKFDKGFLFDYDWLPAFENLSGKDFKELFLALMLWQKENKPIPKFKNPQLNIYASMMLPQIDRRKNGKKSISANDEKKEDAEGDVYEHAYGYADGDADGDAEEYADGDSYGYADGVPPKPKKRKEKNRIEYIRNVNARAHAREDEHERDEKIPSEKDVQEYIKSKGYTVPAERFVDYQEKRGWKFPDGRSVIPVWQSVVDSWAANGIDKVERSFNVDEFFAHACEKVYGD
jgi:hypothetical protein